ncbi:MAG: hypothetical protein GWP59_06385 [Chlamydiales bacterium]|nr:hypothetical protein [Chlamydiales bacterium]
MRPLAYLPQRLTANIALEWNNSWKNRADSFTLSAIKTLRGGDVTLQTMLLTATSVGLRALDVYGMSGHKKISGQDVLIGAVKKAGDKAFIVGGMSITALALWRLFGADTTKEANRTGVDARLEPSNKGKVISYDTNVIADKSYRTRLELTVHESDETVYQFFRTLASPVTGLLKGDNDFMAKFADKAQSVYNEKRLSWWKDIIDTFSNISKPLSLLDQDKYGEELGKKKALKGIDEGRNNANDRLQNYLFLTLRVARISAVAFYEFAKLKQALASGNKDETAKIVAKFVAKSVLDLVQEHYVGIATDRLVGLTAQYANIDKGMYDRDIKAKTKELSGSVYGMFVDAVINGSVMYLRETSGLEDMIR